MFIAICKQLKLVNYSCLAYGLIRRLHLANSIFILTSYTLSSLRLGHFLTKKD